MSKFKSLYFIFILLFCVSCLGKKESVSKKSKVAPTHIDDPKESVVVLKEALKTDMSVKNFNQYNMTLSKLTGIHRSRVIEEFGKIKNSLPSNNNVSIFNSFTQIAFTRLASAYCGLYVDETSDFDFENDTPNLLISKLKVKFLDEEPADNPGIYTSLDSALDSVYLNQLNDTGGKFVSEVVSEVIDENTVVTDVPPEEVKLNLTKVGCVFILSSAFITIM